MTIKLAKEAGQVAHEIDTIQELRKKIYDGYRIMIVSDGVKIDLTNYEDQAKDLVEKILQDKIEWIKSL